MSTLLQLRRGDTAAVASTTGAVGELIVDTTTWELYLQDGSTPGGHLIGGSGGTPAGSNTEIQFNNAGAFGASANLTFDTATQTLSVGQVVLSQLAGQAYITTKDNTGDLNIQPAIGDATHNPTLALYGASASTTDGSAGSIVLSTGTGLGTGINGNITLDSAGDVGLLPGSNAFVFGFAGDFLINSDAGVTGQVITSNGPGNVLTWTTPASSGANSNITSLSGITGLIETPTGITFDTTTPAASAVGRLTWNTADATLDLGLDSQVTLQIGQEQLLRIHNNSGGSFTDGQIVYVNGSSGNFPTIALAKADSELTSKGTIGMVTETIANGDEGFVTILGAVRHINTFGYADGDVLFLSATTAGAFTNVAPTSPDHLVTIGYVVRAHATVGQVFVKVDNGYELDELHDVLITSPTNGQVLTYDSATGLWVNQTPSTSTGVTAQQEFQLNQLDMQAILMSRMYTSAPF